jgi:hypothetical protein
MCVQTLHGQIQGPQGANMHTEAHMSKTNRTYLPTNTWPPPGSGPWSTVRQTLPCTTFHQMPCTPPPFCEICADDLGREAPARRKHPSKPIPNRPRALQQN